MSFQRRRFGGYHRGRQYSGNGPTHLRPGQRPPNRIRYMQVDPQKLVKKAQPQTDEVFVPMHQFVDFALQQDLQHNLSLKGYVTPTPIQDKVIPEVLGGRDVIGLAATGTGKTAAYLLPLLHQLIENTNKRVIIIAPTRELAGQIVDEATSLAQGTQCRVTLIIGGVDVRRQIAALKRQPQIVVGTPGRIKDLANRRSLQLETYRTIVLDEVDRMLDMGFINDIKSIISALSRQRQSLFFSATMSPKAQDIAHVFLHEPVIIRIAPQQPSDNVDQDVVKVSGRNKVDLLNNLLNQPGFDKVLVFGRTKRGMEKLSRLLRQRGLQTATIHGNKSQNQRQRALRAFKQNEVQVLLATDVASRGLDIDNVTHVINYELPETYEDYIHRIGRTGRIGHTGVALTFID